MSDQTDNLPATVAERPAPVPQPINAFGSIEGFQAVQRMAKALASSALVPPLYQGDRGLPNCMLALEIAQRTGSNVLAVVQNLNVIHGKPSWSATYIIAAVNSCGRFTPLQYRMFGEGDKHGCIAWAKDKSTGEVLEGPPVDIAMAKAEGWYSRKDKNGKESSKWPTMSELMLRYRAAAFFGRLYAPEILMGMQTREEVEDVAEPTLINPNAVAPPAGGPTIEHDGAAEAEKPKRRGGRRSKAKIAEDKAAEEATATEQQAEQQQDAAQGTEPDESKEAPQDAAPPAIKPPAAAEPPQEQGGADAPWEGLPEDDDDGGW